MSKVWRKLNRVGKKAIKYKFTTHSHILTINCTPKWHPDLICITWTRHNRKIQSKFSQWEPSLQNSYLGLVYWEKSTDYLEFDVSLYKGINEDKFENKEWSLLIENEEPGGKRRLLATGKLNLNDYVSIEPLFQTDIRNFELKILSAKIKSASISFSLMCQFLKEGKATDDDMVSIASYMSVTSTNNPYLNSNVIFNKNNTKKMRQSGISNFDWDIDNDLVEESLSKEKSDEIDILTDRNDNTEEDIEFYTKLKTSNYLNDDFNNISKNFGSQVQQVTEDFQKDFLKTLNASLDRPSDTAPISQKVPDQIISKEPKKQKPPAPVLKSVDDTNNPFLSSGESKIKEIEATNQDAFNPFLSPTLTNSIEQDLSNPFIEDVIKPIVTKEKRRAPVKIITKKPIEIEATDSNPSSQLSDTGKELLSWCQKIIKSYEQTAYMPANKTFYQLDVTNFTSSWMNGLAFCAIFYHFKPNLIDLSYLNENDPKANLTQAFKASDSEKISRVVDVNDFMKKDKLDQLLIMTYLFQLRDQFEPQPNKQTTPTSLFNRTTSSTSFLSPLKLEKQNRAKQESKLKTTTSTSTPIKQDSLETSMQKKKNNSSYSNPFESDPDEADEEINDKNLANKKAKDLRNYVMSSDSVDSIELSKTTEELIQKVKDQERINNLAKVDNIGEKVKSIINKRRKSSMTRVNSKETNNSFDGECDAEQNNSMTNSASIIGTEYVNQEIINFKNEQKELDEHALFLENKLRSLMENSKKSEKNKELENRLLKEWFLLINRKNSLLIRQQELEIIQNEKNLEKRYELLSDKLRELILIDEFSKTEEQKTAESILLNELINNVMERNNLVLQMDEENKLLNEGEIINEYVLNKTTFQHVEKNCSIQ